MEELEARLKARLKNEVLFDSMTRCLYSVDASIFEVEPLGVVIPSSRANLAAAVRIASDYRTPLTARGAATGITGGALGRGLILDTSKYLTRILEVNLKEEWVLCEPGVIQDDLNRHLLPLGYRLGPDTSTGNRATIGGMAANNAAGARSLHYGAMADHLLGAEIILSNGDCLWLETVSKQIWEKKRSLENREGEIYRALFEIQKEHSRAIIQHIPSIPRRSSGYLLDRLLARPDGSINPASILAGSEGTLGIFSAIKLNIVPALKATASVLLFFDEMGEALRWIPELLSYSPLSLELLDDSIMELGRQSPAFKGQLDWLKGTPKVLLALEFEGQNEAQAIERAETFCAQMKQRAIGYAQTLLQDSTQLSQFWALRKAGLGLLLSKRSYSRAIAFIEDVSVPPSHLAPFMEKLSALLRSKGKKAGIYGHAGAGCLHIRPYLDLRSDTELDLMRTIMLEVTSLVSQFGGTLSGEHGDGWIRSWLNPRLFGPAIMPIFKLLKQTFDPLGILNPGKILPLDEPLENRRSQSGAPSSPPTFLNFGPEGGLALSADLCNGNGLCRKREGLMCPSFQVTRNESDATRGRAQALRGIFQGSLPVEEWTGKALYAVMDLCLSCKGCKTECPSQVDMAKMKAEFLYHYQEKHGYSLRSRLFASVSQTNRLLSSYASLYNYLIQTKPLKKILGWLGIAAERRLPLLTKERFSHWFKDFPQPANLPHQVLLFNDTFTEFHAPRMGQAAVQLLNRLGYRVIVPPLGCCGRPALSKGLLKQGKKQAVELLETLQPFLKENTALIGLEPSCIFTLQTDFKDLFPDQSPWEETLHQLSISCMTLDAFLDKHIPKERWLDSASSLNPRDVLIHTHCHQKALAGTETTLRLLRQIPGLNIKEIASGCCGMAGSFGYEQEHYSLSMEIGELSLFPAVRSSSLETILIANGFSCRHQIADGTSRSSLHLAEFLNEMMKDKNAKEGT